MELDLPMMEIAAAFQGVLDSAKKKLNADAKAVGGRWLRGRIESSMVLRWNSARGPALRLTVKLANYLVRNSAGATVTGDEMTAAIRQLGTGQGKIRMEECPF